MQHFPAAYMAIFVALGAGGDAAKAGKISFSDYADPDGKFSLNMPATPQVTKENTQNPYGDGQVGSYTATVDSARFIVEYEQYPQEFFTESGSRLLENSVSSGRRSGALTVTPPRAIAGGLATIEYEIKQFVADAPRIMKGRLVLVDNRLYDVLVDAAPGTTTAADVTKFLESFKPNP